MGNDRQKKAKKDLFGTHTGYLFTTFYHPYVCEMIRRLNQGGITELLQWPMQPASPGDVAPDASLEKGLDYFGTYYGVDPYKNVVAQPYPEETLDLTNEGST